ncbi:MAG: bifunctional transaldolase/phosoglucose isomerase [Planctomycetes bacterium]|nr:bifunctional transaldolase/phosoglucose isomerase [Planctomycetota bacterium]
MKTKKAPSLSKNPLIELSELGQSVWFDYIKKSLIESGELARMIEHDGLMGVTSNPSIFEKAIAGSNDYDADLAAERANCFRDPKGVYERLAIRDIQAACDVLSGVYTSTKRRDGYVSLEVAPTLAHDTQGTLEEARRLWKTVQRPNLMVKVPATPAGVPAIEKLISEGINVNVTLLFAVDAYLAVARAYVRGLEAFAKKGGPVARVASVASFFVSRIDTALDPLLDLKMKTAPTNAQRELAGMLRGKAAIANAKLAYAEYEKLLATKEWQKLAKRGAMPQRLLWASTSTKNPRYRDVVYAEELVGKDTVDTMPPQTFEAFRDHGRARATLNEGVDDARATLDAIDGLGVDFGAVTSKLLDDGVALFADAFEKLIGAVRAHAKPVDGPRLCAELPTGLASAVDATLAGWANGNKTRRLWNKDASLWTNGDEAQWLGWLDIVDQQRGELAKFAKLANELKGGAFKHCLLLGMGGSSLGPEVLKYTFGKHKGFPELLVLDSTDPQQLRAFEKQIDYAKTIFIVASKSGSTLEPNIFKQYFFERAKEELGAERAGAQFIAITDPGSNMQKVAEADHFGRVFFGVKTIGGRYSVLSDFGMIPAAISGIDVATLLERAAEMARACGPEVAPKSNPGVMLGAILGTAARMGRDKLTIVASPSLSHLGAWLEQLIAESTGKEGKAIVPLEGEELAHPDAYGDDRVFVYLSVAADIDAKQRKRLAALEAAGQPVVRIELADTYDLAAEFFRWEIATAVAGEVLGIHPFNQPDVEASKLETKKLTSAYEETGSLPSEAPFFTEGGIALFTDERNAAELRAATKKPSLVGYLHAHFGRVRPGDYVALLAYVEMNPANEQHLAATRLRIRDSKRVATCLGFGPRFLHSTGQAYKGGPQSCVVVQITCDDARDLGVPNQKYTFGVVKAAQARGDFAVLAERGRRALRVHLGKDVKKGLAKLGEAIKKALR